MRCGQSRKLIILKLHMHRNATLTSLLKNWFQFSAAAYHWCLVLCVQFSVGKYLHLGPSARLEANAILAISQPYISMNNFTAAASQKFKSCSCFMLQDYTMTSLDKHCSIPLPLTSKHRLWSYVSVSIRTEVFHGDLILQEHDHFEKSFFITLSSKHFKITPSIALYAQLLYIRHNCVKFSVFPEAGFCHWSYTGWDFKFCSWSVFCFGLCVWLHTTSSVG